MNTIDRLTLILKAMTSPTQIYLTEDGKPQPIRFSSGLNEEKEMRNALPQLLSLAQAVDAYQSQLMATDFTGLIPPEFLPVAEALKALKGPYEHPRTKPPDSSSRLLYSVH